MARLEANARAIANCGREQEKAPLTEPTIVPNVFLTGGAVAVHDTFVRLVGYEEIASIDGEMAERRIVSRLVMSNQTAREVVSILQQALAKGGH